MSVQSSLLSNDSIKGVSPTANEPRISNGALKVSPLSGSIRLERESRSWRTLFFLSSASITLEVTRQVCSYAMKYYNAEVFPMPSTFLVFLTELLKMAVILAKIFWSGNLCPCSISFAYLVPSTLYAVNNNIYFLALYFTTPAVWNILMQSRLIFIALVYRFYFKKTFTYTKWGGLLLLTTAIVILQWSGSDDVISEGVININMLMALGLALIASVFAAIGPVFTEFLLKHDKRPFDEKQLLIYMFGSLVTGVFFFLDRYARRPTKVKAMLHVTGDKSTVCTLIVLSVGCSVAGGIVVANIIKKLDNIVKLYAQAVSSALTAIACVILFPLVFQFDASFIVSFLLTIVAIYLYESPDPWCQDGRSAESLS